MNEVKARRVDTGIVQRGKNYRFTAYLGYDASGRQIRKTMTFSPPLGLSKSKADKLAKTEYINFCNRCRGWFHLKENMRFSELIEEYLQIYVTNLKPITAYNYEKHIHYHFIEEFGRKRLREFSPAMISHFFATHKTVIHGELKLMSPGNAKKSYCILQSIFSFAVSQGYLRDTPCRNVILPKKDVLDKEVRTCLNEHELPVFLSLFETDQEIYTIIKVLLFTGIRLGECLGLQWADIDFKNKKLYIHHTLSDVAGQHFLTTPKTKTSVRYLYMSEQLVTLFQNHYIYQTTLQQQLGEKFLHPEMVFTSNSGNYKDRSGLSQQFRRKLKGTEFEFMTLHKLRHTTATMLLNYGVDLKIVSEYLGHSDISITADIYTEVLDRSKMKTANTMEKILNKKAPKKHQKEGNEKKFS